VRENPMCARKPHDARAGACARNPRRSLFRLRADGAFAGRPEVSAVRELAGLPSMLAKVGVEGAFWKVLAAVPAGVAAYLWPTDALERLAVGCGVMFLIDWLAGLMLAVQERKVSSAGFLRVFVKLVAYGCYMGVAATLPVLVPVEALQEYRWVPISVVMSGLGVNDAISVLEKLKRLGIGVDKRLVKLLMARLESGTEDGKE